MIDITGQRFGRLRALFVHHSSAHRERYWLCICDCGKEVITRQSRLTSGKAKSCGCGRRKTPIHAPVHSRTKAYSEYKERHKRLYRIWQSMKSRCYYPKNKNYSCYGGRGISICDEWRNDFETFSEWALSNGYDDNLTIDRIDVDGNYSPNNCRWATNAEQQRNKRKTPRSLGERSKPKGAPTP